MSDELRISRRTFMMGIVTGVLILAIMGIYVVFLRPERQSADAPTERNFAEQMSSEHSLFVVSYTPVDTPIMINAMHEWTLHVESADGEPVEGAAITVDGGMPDHGHGLPTVPQVTEDLGGGDYRVEGVKFQMPGWWVVTFNISADGQSDSVTFNLQLN